MCLCYYLSFLHIVYYFVVPNEAAKILAVYPTPSISHQVVFRPLMEELAKRGHELVVLTTDPAYSKGNIPKNITEIDLHKISYDVWAREFVNKVHGSTSGKFEVINSGMKALSDIFEIQFHTPEFQSVLKNQHYDLIFIEACVRVALSISYVVKAPVIQISSFGAFPQNYESMGSINHPIFTPVLLREKLYNLSLWDKFFALYEEMRTRYIFWVSEDHENSIIKKILGPKAPTIAELSNNVEMLFLNTHPIWEGNRAVPPGVIHLGGMHQTPKKELPNELKMYLDKSKHGVIYMSFGTNVSPSLLPPERIQLFVKVFSKLPYDVIWKWNLDTLPNQPENVRISKWLPQSDLLRHPKIKLFITQGGLQSTDEAITAGVPLIGFPMLGDQWYNCEKYPYHGIGLKFELESITEKVLEESIKNVIEDPSYRHNVARLRELMYDQPLQTLERAVWWTEYVIRHRGAKHLRSPLANISWAEYLMADVIFVLLSVLSTFILLSIFAVYTILKINAKKRIKLKEN